MENRELTIEDILEKDMNKRLKDIDIELDSIKENRTKLDDEKESIMDTLELSRASVLRKQKYWKAGNQDFFYVGKKEYVHIKRYQGGGGFDISQGIPSELLEGSYYNRHEPEISNETEFDDALKTQQLRISEMKKLIPLDKT